MSDRITHECGVALVRLLKPLSDYQEKYGSPLWGFTKLFLLMEKQHNRGQDGAGVAVTSRLLAEEHLARGELVHILPAWIFSRYTIYAALPSGRMLPARTKVFLDFLSEQVPLAVADQRGQQSK